MRLIVASILTIFSVGFFYAYGEEYPVEPGDYQMVLIRPEQKEIDKLSIDVNFYYQGDKLRIVLKPGKDHQDLEVAAKKKDIIKFGFTLIEAGYVRTLHFIGTGREEGKYIGKFSSFQDGEIGEMAGTWTIMKKE